MTGQVMSAALFLITILLVLVGFEQVRLSVNKIGLVASLATIAAVGRVAAPIVPGFQLTTFIIIVTGISFGSAVGFSTAVLAVIISNFFLGHGPWTPFQILAWGLCGAGSGLIGRNTNRLLLVLWGGVWGFVFGWMMNLWQWLAFVSPLNFKSWIAINIVSLPLDVFHALTNMTLLWILGAETITALKRFNNRLNFKRISISDNLLTTEPNLNHENI